jgi:hypothetical protein
MRLGWRLFIGFVVGIVIGTAGAVAAAGEIDVSLLAVAVLAFGVFGAVVCALTLHSAN